VGVKEEKMNYRALLIIFAALLLGLGQAVYGQTVSYKEGLKQAAERIGARVSTSDIAAVVEFRAATSRFSDRVIDDLIDELIAVKARVVDRQNLEAVRAEQRYQYSGYVDDDSAVSLGHELGATVIILGGGENMADYYRLNFRMLSVETGEILARFSVNVRYDQAMRRLLDERAAGSQGIGTTHFLIGGRLGAGFEINTADEDMVGSGYSPKEKSNTAFNAALYGAWRFNDVWSVQAELNFMLNNGMEISGQGSVVRIDYATIDIPLLVRWNFIQSPVVVGLAAGPYISLPAGKLNLSVDDRGAALDMSGNTFGIAGGFTLSYKLGPGSLTADVRYINDFGSLYVHEDFGEGMQQAKICIRRSINITAGYEFSL
jgi:hypothetical protein